MKPLEGILILEFSQYLAAPSAGLRLADLGARVIKIERPTTGDGSRQLAIKNLFVNDGDSLLFHTINRNKESYVADLKNPEDIKCVKKLIKVADVMTNNFRPGIMDKIGLDYNTVKAINPKLVYGVVSGYGSKGPWAKKPGQDLLIQAISGLTYLSGSSKDHPTPMGLAVSDMLTGVHLAQGILAILVRRGKTQKGGLVEVSLLESTLDLQFEVLTTYFNDGHKSPKRANKGNAHAYLGAPYGIYQTRDSHISLAMTPIDRLAYILNFNIPEEYKSEESSYKFRDEIMDILCGVFKTKTTQEWLDTLQKEDIWCSNVYDYQKFLKHEGYKVLKMDQEVVISNGKTIRTTRCPIRINEERYYSSKSAPLLGQDNMKIIKEFNL